LAYIIRKATVLIGSIESLERKKGKTMKRRLFLHASLCGALVLSLSACASKPDPELYADTSCETLRTLQTAYSSDVPIVTSQPLSDGINEVDQNRRSQQVFSPSTDSSLERKRKSSIRAAYKKNGCSQ